MDAVCAQLADCQSPVAAVRQAAELALGRAGTAPGFLPLLLQVAGQGPAACRLPAAILLKNTVARAWVDSGNAAAPLHRISAEDRTYLKGHLVRNLVDSPVALQRQLAACVTAIAAHDFPGEWPGLVPELVAHLSARERGKVRAVLQTLQEVTQPYRFKGKNEALWLQIKYVLVNTAQPLLECLMRLAADLAQCATPTDRNDLLSVLTLLAHVFLSLSSQDIPEQFEEKLGDWMAHWLGFLTMPRGESPPAPTITDHDEVVDPPQPIDDLQGVICEIGSLYAEKYEEEFRGFIPAWVSAVYQLLIMVGSATALPLPRHDPVRLGALHFLTGVVARPWNKSLFADSERLRALCERIVLPNLTLQQPDIAMFYQNPIEYVRRDSEGSDQATRRRLTCDLVRALTVQFAGEVAACLFGYVTVLLQEFAKAPDANWVQADAAMYVVLALAVQGRTQEKGATIVNQHVDVASFYALHVQPQLADDQVDRLPLLKADAIKFVSTFRSHFPVDQCRDLIPILARFLASASFVVHSYAASAIERLLALKNCVTRAHLQPFVPQLLTQLFSTLDHDESAENDYVLRAIMRVLCVAGEDVLPFLDTLLSRLTTHLVRAASNPRNPIFNHLLFECVAILLRLGQTHPDLVPRFQSALFPPFQSMLQIQDACSEFAPYVFQIMCVVLDATRGDTLSAAFAALYPMLMTPALWESQGNVHALVQLLQAYLRKPGFVATLGSAQGAEAERLPALLGVFQKLISSTLNDRFGMALLRAMLRHVPWLAGLQPHMKQIFVLVFSRAQSSMTPQFGRAFALFLAEFICVRGLPTLFTEMEAVQSGIGLMTMEKIFLPQAALIVQPPLERKLVQIALVYIVCHSLEMVGRDFVGFWARALDCLLDQLEAGTTESVTTSEDHAERMLDQLGDGVSGGVPAYSAAYSRLAFAVRVDSDPFPNITDPATYFATSLGDASRSHPGQIRQMLDGNLPPARAAVVQDLCAKAMVQLS